MTAVEASCQALAECLDPRARVGTQCDPGEGTEHAWCAWAGAAYTVGTQALATGPTEAAALAALQRDLTARVLARRDEIERVLARHGAVAT